MKNTTFAKRLTQALKIRGITAAEFSRRMGISEAVISQYRSGKYEPKQDRLDEFAKALDVSEGWLMGYDVPMERQSPEESNKPADNVDELVDAIRSDPRKYLLAKRLFELSDSEFDRIERVFDAMLDPLPEETDPVDQE